MVLVAMCQIFCLDGDREGNYLRVENALIEARDAGAQLAMFPEMALMGWVNPDAHERSYPIPGEDTDRLGALARQYGMYICIGLGEKDGDKLYNSVTLIDDKGEVLLTHRKINTLVELMDPPYAQGTQVDTVDTPLGRVGLLICADTFREDILERMKALKPELLLIPYGWAANEDEWPQHGKNLHDVVANAALKTGTPAVGVDLVGAISKGSWAGKTYGGHSVAAASDGTLLASAADRDRDIVFVNVPVTRGDSEAREASCAK